MPANTTAIFIRVFILSFTSQFFSRYTMCTSLGLPLWLKNRLNLDGIGAKPFPGVPVRSIRFKHALLESSSPNPSETDWPIPQEAGAMR